MNKLNKIILIAVEEHKIAWRSRRLIGITIFIALAALVLLVIYSKIPRTMMIILINFFLDRNLSFGPAKIDFMQAQVDLFFSMSNIVISFVLLLASILLGYDSISGGKETNSIRFIFSKVDRKIYIFGKFLAHMFYVLIVIVTIYLIMLFYVYFKIGSFEIVNILTSILFFIIYMGSWTAIFMLISTISKKSSLFIAFLLPLFFLLILLSRLRIFSPFNYLSFNMADFLWNSLYLLPFIIIPLFISGLLIEVMDF